MAAQIGRQNSFQAPKAAALDEDLFSSAEGGKGKNFKVVVRVRPFNSKERKAEHDSCVQVNQGKSITVTKPDTDGAKTHNYAYDRVYDHNCNQETVYVSAIRSVVLSTLNGYNGSIIAYGQTGTGKTHTMEGDAGDMRGIIPRAAEEIFNFVEQASKDDSKFLVRVSFLQIYCEKIADLLDKNGLKKVNDKGHLAVREDPSGGVYVNNLSEHIVKSADEIMQLLKDGSALRTVASTDMNMTSSRSHAVFSMIVEHSENRGDGESCVTIGKLHLVDLAGSERVKSTGITLSDGKRMDEAKNINSSLTAFGKVILALTSKGNTHVPYRDSKLTRLLQGSLGGNSKTTMITAAGPSAKSYIETLNSLKFASRAKLVKNYAVVNEDMTDQALLSAYQKEITRLKLELAKSKESYVPQPLANIPEPETVVVVDTEAIDQLKKLHSTLSETNNATKAELEQKIKQVNSVQEEKMKLEKRMKAMQTQLLSGGTNIEEQPEFRSAVTKSVAKVTSEVEGKLKTEYESRFAALEEERARLDQERAAFERERAAFEKERRAFRQGAGQTLTPPEPEHADDQPPPLVKNRRLSQMSQASTHQSWAEHGNDPVSPTRGAPDLNSLQEEDVEPQGRPSVVSNAPSEYDDEYDDDEGGGNSSPDTVGLDTYLKALCHRSTGIQTHDARHNHQYYRKVFSGETASTWFVTNMEGVESDDLAQSVGQKFLQLKVIISLSGLKKFSTAANELYTFAEYDSGSKNSRPKTPVRVRPPSASRRGSSDGRPYSTPGRRSSNSSLKEDLPRRPSSSGMTSPGDGSDLSTSPRNAKPGRPKTASRLRRRVSAIMSAATGLGSKPNDTRLTKSHSSAELSYGLQQAADAAHEADANPEGGIMDTSIEDAGATLLHSAAGQGNKNAMKTFLQTFPIDCTDNMGRTPLMYSCINNKPKAVEVLSKAGANLALVDSTGRSALFFAAYYGHHDVLKVLLKSDPILADARDPEGRTPLHWATKHASSKCLDVLLKVCTPEVIRVQDHESVTALHWAVLCRSDDHTAKLLKAGATIMVADFENRTPIHYAVCNNAVNCLSILLENRDAADVANLKDIKGRAALHLAVNSDHALECVMRLLSYPFTDANCTDAASRTPLHWAAACNRPDVVQALWSRGGNLNMRDESGRTPMHYASEKGNQEAAGVMQMILLGADPDKRSQRKSSITSNA